MKSLKYISPKTLANRSKELEREGSVKREVFAEIPPRVEYSLTSDGDEVRDSMIPWMEWASRKRPKSSQFDVVLIYQRKWPWVVWPITRG
jgi:DNA-binding HxlR family transcriptional regulator